MKIITYKLKRLVLFTIILISFFIPFFAEQPSSSEGRRLALVVGNSAYQVNPLKNPVNDAEDVAAALRETGFEVCLVKDADSAAFERAVIDFVSSLKEAETGLFYYAGHGVQVDGMNYLIPVSPRIDDTITVKARAMPVDVIVGRMETSGVKTALVFLDSCRDNPFPGANRSGTRGLAVIAAPKTKNSMIAYATSPGDTAADGTGRNGIFSAAFLEQLKNPGTELTSMMKAVKANVSSVTNNKQNPRVDDGMKEDFFFADPVRLSAQAKSKAEAAAAEVASLERALADRKAQIAVAKSASEKQKLELEQQKQQAVATAKKLEAENLARESERQAVLAKVAREQKSTREKELAAAGQRQDELSKLAQNRKAELDKLALDAQSDNPDILIETVERLEKAITEVNNEYERALIASIAQMESTWQVKFTELKNATAEPWESDADFVLRIKQETDAIQKQKDADIAHLRAEIDKQRLVQTVNMQTQFDKTLKTLTDKRWILSGNTVSVQPGTYDRNTKLWLFLLGCTDPCLPLSNLVVYADLSKVIDLKTDYMALETALKANALVGELEWGIERQKEKQRYAIKLYSARVRNLIDNSLSVNVHNLGIVAYFTEGHRVQSYSRFTQISIKASESEAELFIDGKKIGKGTWVGSLKEGLYEVSCVSLYSRGTKKIQIQEADIPQTIFIDLEDLKVGDIGPAGGYIFYDKGLVSDGWRYLEASPVKHIDGLKFITGRGEFLNMPSETAVGTGKSNTEKFLNRLGLGNNAASICSELVIGQYDDWFLPSKDELALMYKNLHRTGLIDFGWKYYGSSSYDPNSACFWAQDFYSGDQFLKEDNFAYIRAVRAF